MVTRRDFLISGLALTAMPTILRGQAPAADGVFRHGVASGDPLRDRVVLWTRVTPAASEQTVDVGWMLARDARMSRVVASGYVRTSAARDYTVKVDAAALSPGSTYYYRFSARGARSAVGRTRTLPARPTARVTLALASCANYPFGFFNVYGRIAARPDLDAVLHLGDYIYEYPNAGYSNGTGDGRPFDRVPFPDRELLSLDDYRGRYAQYRTDPDLQAAHRQHPFIVIWDDHESANNSWSGGARNHNPAEGEWRVRRDAAVRAWREWMPVRDTPGNDFRLYRQFAFGDLADVLMLDTRLEGRDQQVVSRDDVAALDRASRQLLGAAQEDWLFEGLKDSAAAGKPWQILGQQVMFAPQSPLGAPAANTDSWDGYRAARNRVFDAATGAGVKQLVVLTGDVHSAWAYDLARDPFTAKYNAATGRGAMGAEIVTPAVTSPGGPAPDRVPALMAARPHLKYVVGQQRGYTVVDITRERLQADWWFVPTITERSTSEQFGKGMVVEAGRPHLTPVSNPVPTRSSPDPAPEFL
jgi:alkaline phosphatase D